MIKKMTLIEIINTSNENDKIFFSRNNLVHKVIMVIGDKILCTNKYQELVFFKLNAIPNIYYVNPLPF